MSETVTVSTATKQRVHVETANTKCSSKALIEMAAVSASASGVPKSQSPDEEDDQTILRELVSADYSI